MTRFAAILGAIMLLLCVAAATVAIHTLPPPGRGESIAKTNQDVALITLLTAPERFDRGGVTVTGFLIAEEDEAALYLSEDDAIARTGNKLALVLDGFLREDLEPIDKLYVRLSGTFRRSPDFPLGTVMDVTRILPAARGLGGRLRYDDAMEVLPQGAR